MRQITKAATRRRYERGAIAVEAAMVIPILLLTVAFPSLPAALYYRQYSAAQKAMHDAALYLSTAPRIEMTTAGPDGAPAAITVAKTIMAREMAELVPSGTSVGSDFICLYRTGGIPAVRSCTVANNQDPTQTLLQIGVTIRVDYVNPITGSTTAIAPYAPATYVGG
jgi:Flp pilus assembly protein TadG